MTNAAENLKALGLASGYSFLNQLAGFDISFSIIEYDRTTATNLRVFFVGVTNTLFLSLVCIVLATILGTVIGILQLLGNLPLEKVCRAYIETTRNIPVLLQLSFWYICVLSAMPHLKNSLSLFDAFFLNVRGLYVPWPVEAEGTNAFWVALIVGAVTWFVLSRWALRKRVNTGQSVPGNAIGFGIFVALIAGAWLIFGAACTWEVPVLKGFNFRGGAYLPPEFVAMMLGLSIYTAGFIAELVRGGILAVSKGQYEAASSLGLSDWRVMRLVMIPQAMRLIVPPLTSQYLNVVKNSSLGVAIAYPDVVSVFTGTTLNQTGRAIEIVAMTMAFYLTISLLISIYMNWYNKRVALVER
ncbi:MAG: ABC transporter permease subunit [Silicimonas sp.]|nr:ABC transporter permease subunit [Silicimonas sp.]